MINFLPTSCILILETTASPTEWTNKPLGNSTLSHGREYSEPEDAAASSPSKKNIYIALFVTAGFLLLAFGGGFYFCHRKLKFAKDAKYGLVYSPKPLETTVQYRSHEPSVGGSSSSYGSTVPLIRQRSLRSRLGSNLTQVSEVEMPLDEKWEIDRENINLLEVLGEGAFGRVMKAEVLGLPNMPFRFEVAVKMLKGEPCIFLTSRKHYCFQSSCLSESLVPHLTKIDIFFVYEYLGGTEHSSTEDFVQTYHLIYFSVKRSVKRIISKCNKGERFTTKRVSKGVERPCYY